MEHVIAIVLAYVLDTFIGDPRTWPHPVKWFGKLIGKLENSLNKGKGRRLKGVFMLTILVILTFIISLSIILLAYKVHMIIGIIIEAILIATTIAQKGLKDASLSVYEPLLAKDYEKARKELAEI